MLLTLIIFIAILGLLIFVHELGHFIAAKKVGVKVEEFAFGFRPRLFAKKIGETEYAINLIPLGGYVKLFGEDGAKGESSLFSASLSGRTLIVLAGVIMNIFLGYIIFVILFLAGFNPLIPGVAKNPFITNKQELKITKVNENSPAALAGFQAGDQVVSVDGQEIASDFEFIALIAQKAGTQVKVEVKRQDKSLVLSAVPRKNPPEGEGALGVGISQSGEVKADLINAPLAAGYEVGRVVGLSAGAIGNLFKKLIVEQKLSEDVTGIIGVGALTGLTRRLGFQYLAQLVAVVTLGLAIIQLVPILPLDGGHLVVIGYQAVTKKRMTEKQMGIFSAIGLALVLLLFVAVTYKDIIRFNIIGRFL